jgi:pimeloyl-ACP methyl ester carboxylesterase/DNA-binding CsgD family transcriptional regulator
MAHVPVGYARTDDGVTIAYSIVGEGPVALILVSPMVSQVELVWEEPALASFVRRLASCTRVVLFDRRGTGLSDRSTASGDRLSLKALASDTKAVLDAAQVERAVLLGVTFGCMIAVQFAVDFPNCTQALILSGGFAKLNRLGHDDFTADPNLVDAWADRTAASWGTGVTLAARAPAMAHNDGYLEWAARMERNTCSPGMIAAMCRTVATYDVRNLLGSVRVPTLVLHRKDDQMVPLEEGRHLSQGIEGSQYVELPGENHTIFVGDQRAAVEAMTTFLDRTVAAGALKAYQRAERKDIVGFGWQSLTPAEREIAQLVATGLTNVEVASRLGMSRFTVDGRLRRVFAKLGVNSRAELSSEVVRATS